jgi:DNA polymerase-3 subunit epsilon
MTFTAIDFETAHAKFPCEIGVCRVEDNIIRETHSWLIKPACFPYMNYWCYQTHGISSKMVQNEPTFDELWTELFPFLEDTLLIAHNASFDISVLRATLQYYNLAIPHSEYLCSVLLSRRAWKGLPSYRLNDLCQLYDIHFYHHRAGADAEACARLVLKIGEERSVTSITELSENLGVCLKLL